MENNVSVEFMEHRNEVRAFLFCKYHAPLVNFMKDTLHAKWSQTHIAFYIANNRTVIKQLWDYAKSNSIVVEFKNKPTDVIIAAPIETTDDEEVVLPTISAEALEKINEYQFWLKSRRYSDSTIGTYSNALNVFFKYFNYKPLADISNTDIIEFNNLYILNNNLSSSYQNQFVNAIKTFYRNIQYAQIDIAKIHRPKREKLLPNVLSKAEVKAILAAPINIKHKAMLSLIYACGLRCGELIKLKPEHIDAQRHVLIIKQAKGRKDRIAPLSEKIIDLLRQYFTAYKPTIYLFEGQVKGEMYDARSLQEVIKQSTQKAGVQKPVTLHWLRHSYATHLLEAGTDLRYIQEILGHTSSRTTEIYTHVSNHSIQKIVSPFDNL